MTDIEFVPILVLGLLVYTLTNLARVPAQPGVVVGRHTRRRLGDRDPRSVAGRRDGVGCMITVGGTKTLDGLSFPETLLVGSVVTAAGSVVYDLKRSFDGSDSAATPPLLPTRDAAPPPAAPLRERWAVTPDDDLDPCRSVSTSRTRTPVTTTSTRCAFADVDFLDPEAVEKRKAEWEELFT